MVSITKLKSGRYIVSIPLLTASSEVTIFCIMKDKKLTAMVLSRISGDKCNSESKGFNISPANRSVRFYKDFSNAVLSL